MTHGQGVELEIDESLLEHLAEEGYRPEFGARELRRLIRSQIETQLARAMLANDVREGQRVLARWDREQDKVVLEPQAEPDSATAGKRGKAADKTAVEIERKTERKTGKDTKATAAE
jgi:ATP-dependent Clp protease ATP-binding subunit ClpC